jgi:excinuclease ABC subunit B
MANFKISSDFKPTGDQPQAIEKLTRGLNESREHQVLLGVTGSGKTFSMANVIQNIQRPTLVISHNKTLAGQLAQEFRSLFPNNAVEYFVSYYDYYQPEAYIPQSDTYIEKDANINEEIEKLRLSATTSLMTRKDVIVVASVSAIYNLGNPVEYGQAILELKKGMKATFDQVQKILTKMFYERNDYEFKRGNYRVRGDVIDIFPSYLDNAFRVQFLGDKVERVAGLDPLTGYSEELIDTQTIFPAKHYITPEQRIVPGIKQIEIDLEKRLKELRKLGKLVEAQRLEQRTQYDLEMIRQYGYCNGIENYSIYFDGRASGEPPYTLMHFFPKDFLLFIDESHISLPQIRGMYNGDRARKETLVEYGFRLPSAMDNRPMKFDEFQRLVNQVIYVSATPNEYELSLATTSTVIPKKLGIQGESRSGSPVKPGMTSEDEYDGVAQQLIRPTGILDPEIEVRPTEGQIDDLLKEIEIRVKKGERTLVTTLTKRMAEDLSAYLEEKGIKVNYLHSDIETLKRTDILQQLRLGEFDVLVGINLLREGLDLPEVSLVAILDADKEGFLRSRTSLIQTMGRAARHIEGKVIMYADEMTMSMHTAIEEVQRRRIVQDQYNKANGITPKAISKPLRDRLIEAVEELEEESGGKVLTVEDIPPEDKKKMIKLLEQQMKEAAEMLDFETAAKLRDQIKELS